MVKMVMVIGSEKREWLVMVGHIMWLISMTSYGPYDTGHMLTSPIISRVSSPMKVSTSPSRKHRSISRWVVTYIYKVTGVSSPLGRLPKSFL